MSKQFNDFLERYCDCIVCTTDKGELSVWETDSFIEEIVPTVKKVDYIGYDLAIVILNTGVGLRVEPL